MILQDFHYVLLALLLLIVVVETFALGWPLSGEEPSLARPRYRTLADAMSVPGDNFLLLRMIAACAVIYGHSYAMSGIPGAADHIARLQLGTGMYAGSLAVDVFFAISGFLVTGSWLRRSDLGQFLRARILRIVPGYFACLVLSAFVLGAIVTELPLRDYLLAPDTRGYVLVNLWLDSDLHWTLPGVFVHNPHPDVVNGSLWTLPAEVRAYEYLAVFGVLGLLERRMRFAIALIGLLAFAVAAPEKLPLLGFVDYARLVTYFVAGAVFYVFRQRVPFGLGWLAALTVLAVLSHKVGLFAYVFPLWLCYGCLWLAYGPKFLLAYNRLGDYSYGVYLWGFPIQQVVAQQLSTPTPTVITLFSVPIAIAFGVASWYLIERPATRLGRARSVPHRTETPAH
jgi:peptidoglycan/LPS O-acetylase OafA/YrhL